MMTFRSTRSFEFGNLGAIAVPEQIYQVAGTTDAVLLSRPSPQAVHLVLFAEKGDFRMRLGDKTGEGEISAADPTASVSDGSGSLPIKEGTSLVIPAPDAATVITADTANILSYFWA